MRLYTLNNKQIAATVLATLAILCFATFAFANPFFTGGKSQTATATTSPTFMTPGTATTTLIYDSYEQCGTNQTNTGNLTIPNSLAFMLNGNASSTGTSVNTVFEFSDNYNCLTGNGDWYQNDIVDASTTFSGQQSVTTGNSYLFAYASTTPGGAAVPANWTRFQKMMLVQQVPTRFVRAIISLPAGSTNASVWGQFVPKKQRN